MPALQIGWPVEKTERWFVHEGVDAAQVEGIAADQFRAR